MKVISHRFPWSNVFRAWRAACVMGFYFVVLGIGNSHVSASGADSSKQNWIAKFEALEYELNHEQVSKQEYLELIDSTVAVWMYSGVDFSTEELSELLHPYAKIIFTGTQYEDYRAKYFRHLMNNAYRKERSGKLLFYAEKLQLERDKKGVRTFLIPYLKQSIYNNSGDSKKSVELFESKRSHIDSLVHTPMAEKSSGEYMQAMQYLYTAIKHTYPLNREYAKEMKDYALKLDSNIQNSITPDMKLSVSKYIPTLFSYYANLIYAELEENTESSFDYLDQVKNIIYNDEIDIQDDLRYHRTVYHNYYYSLYIRLGNQSLAKAHLDSLSNLTKVFKSESGSFLTKKAELAYLDNHLDSAIDYISQFYNYISDNTSEAQDELYKLQYASAKNSLDKLLIEENRLKSKKQVVILLLILGITLSILIFAVYYIRKERKKQEEVLENLRNVSSFAIEEAKFYSIEKEQERLGQELHDDMSSSLASALHQVENIFAESKNINQAEHYQYLRERIQDVYEGVRNKSHAIYYKDSPNPTHFKDGIVNFMHGALIDKDYNIYVDIEEGLNSEISLQQRIDIINILHEVLSVIIKNNTATEVSLLLYKDGQNNVTLQIHDNREKMMILGKGWRNRKIKRKIESIDGELEVIYDADGVTNLIQFPLS